MRKYVALVTVPLLLGIACKSTGSDGDEAASDETPGGTSEAVEDDRAPGVTDDAIAIGITYPDFEALGDSVDINHGDYEAAYRAVIDDINANGGIHGRALEPMFAPVDPSSPTSTDETCTRLTQDEQVFVALGLFFGEAMMCYLGVNETAVVGGDMTDDRLAQAQAPWFAYEGSDVQADGVQTLIDGGDLTGSIAVLLSDSDQALYEGSVKPLLDDAGIEVVETGILSTAIDPDQAPAEARTVFQRFESSGVDTVLAIGQGTAVSVGYGLTDTAYRPDLRFNNTNGLNAYARDEATDVTVFDGAIGVGVYGPPDAWLDLRDPTAACFDLQRDAGLTLNPPSSVAPGEPNQVVSSLAACQQLTLLAALLEGAGEELNYGTFTTAGYELGEVELPGEPEPLTYGPPPHADGDRPLYRYEFDVDARQFAQAFS